jgi:type II secretory pathway component PulF
MSREPDEIEPRNPRRHRPVPGAGGGAARGGSDEEYSTFRPNPLGAAPARKPAAKKKRGAGDMGAHESVGGGFERPAPGPTWWERILFGRVSTGQLAQFCRQFGSYLHAGVDLNRTLASLERQFGGTALGPILGRVHGRVRGGTTLEEALAKEPQAFDSLFLSLIKVAEARGGVPETLRMLGEHYEARQRLIRTARSAMIYPVVVLVIATGVTALVTIFLLPRFAALLKDIAGNMPLPLASRILMGISQFVQIIGWWLIPLVLISTPVLLVYFYKTPAGKRIMDQIALRIPVFGKLCRMLDTARFARTLSVLLDAGVDVGSSIDLTADVMRMSPMRRAVRRSRQSVMAGSELSTSLDRTRQFTPDIIAVIGSGEETGKLPESLIHLADDYDEQVAMMVANLGHLVQPLMMILLGLIVLFIILAVILPIIQLISNLAAPGAL